MTVVITGWRPGLKTISLISRLRTRDGMELTEAMHAVDGLLDGRNIRLQLEEEAKALALKNDAEELGAICIVEGYCGPGATD